MDQIIIAFSGRKAAGKNTIAKYVASYYAVNKAAREFPDPLDTCEIPERSYEIEEKETLECSFADNLKAFCIDTLGLAHEQCYGTDDEKNSPTEYDWKNAPRFLAWKFGDKYAKELVAEGMMQDGLISNFVEQKLKHECDFDTELRYRTGKMTGRDIMQIVGTDLCRQTFGNIWAAATVRMIKKQGKALNLITDNRFPNEIEIILDQPYGYVVRLTRSPFGTVDAHPSESALDDYDWNRDKCFVLDNAKMSIEEQNEAIKPLIDKICNFSGSINYPTTKDGWVCS